MDSALLDDPWIAAQVDAAVAPYVGRLPAEEVAWMREQLVEVLLHDNEAIRLLRRGHPREVDESGERPLGAHDAVSANGRAKAG